MFGGTRGVIIPTLLQMSNDILQYFTGITCLYNRYWDSDPVKVTLPICLFHVTKITEQWQNEVSTKRVILYEPQGFKKDAEAVDPLREGVMQSIVDNIVRQPKSYSMEIIVPFQPLGKYITREAVSAYSIFNELISLFVDVAKEAQGVLDIVSSVFSSSMALQHTTNQAVEKLGLLPGLNGISYINKNSLEAMAESGKVLTMKMWTGYDYKYVAITNLSLDKQGTEDDVFRGTMNVQEMPILTMTKPTKYAVKSNTTINTIVTKITQALTIPIIKLTGVDSNSYSSAGSSLEDSVKNKPLGDVI